MASFDVVELPDTDHVEAGDRAIDFTRPLVNRDFWEDVALSSLVEEGPVLLFAYPMDGTGGAKGNWIDIRNRGWGANGLTVIGISISTPYAHKRLIDRHDLPYQLFSDPSAGVAEKYGIPHDYDGMNGIVGHRPSFFLVDDSMTVAYAWVTNQWTADVPFDEVEEAINSL